MDVGDAMVNADSVALISLWEEAPMSTVGLRGT
jgi:hypothetical protein